LCNHGRSEHRRDSAVRHHLHQSAQHSGASHYHIMYWRHGQRWITFPIVVRIPTMLPKFHIALPSPGALEGARSAQRPDGRHCLAPSRAAKPKLVTRRQRRRLSPQRRAPAATEQVIETPLPQRAAALLHELAGTPRNSASPWSRPSSRQHAGYGSSGDVRKGQDSVLVIYQRLSTWTARRSPSSAMGAGSGFAQHGGSIVNASRVWRDLQAPSASVQDQDLRAGPRRGPQATRRAPKPISSTNGAGATRSSPAPSSRRVTGRLPVRLRPRTHRSAAASAANRRGLRRRELGL